MAGVHKFAEYAVDTVLLSAMEHAFVQGDNSGMTATDTQKNTVYYVAKTCLTYERHSPEDFAIALARHFVKEYPLVSRAEVMVKMMPWRRYAFACFTSVSPPLARRSASHATLRI